MAEKVVGGGKLNTILMKFEDLKIYDREDPTNGQSNLQKTYSKNVLKFLKDLKTSTSSYLQALQAIDIMDPQLDCPKLLQSIATEQNFEIIYIPIEQRGKNVENTVGDCQNGFWKGRSTTEQILNIRQILEKTKEFGIDMHHLFIDFKTAYHSINRQALFAGMKEFKIPDKLLRLINLTLSVTKIIVKVQNDLSSPLKNIVQQGDTLVCLLFNLALEKVVRNLNINTRGNIFNKLLTFADDIDIITRTSSALRLAFLSLEKEALRMGLKINETKTKYMPCTKSCFNNSHSKIELHCFEVDSFTYLGSESNNRNNCTTEIRKKITIANRCLNRIRKYIKSNLIKRKTKVLLYKSLLRSVLTYACETWSMSRTDENITSLPVAVCFGSAMSKEEAVVSSARNALNFIQLMCKK
ncbi:putative endonuclease-reverse transcriptase [Trichonephila clavipes]|nr:putative endonuclease-reverse transcriptase [Trichonephila clavipes]